MAGLNYTKAIFAISVMMIATQFHGFIAHSHSSSSDIIDNSFKRLKSGEDSDEEINQCCGRETKFVTIGHGLDAEEIRVDVGYCRQHCEVARTRPLKREEFDKFLKKYPDVDPIQIYLSLQNQQPTNGEEKLTLSLQRNHTLRTSTLACLSSSCQPILIRREQHFDLAGQHQYIDVVDSCDCVTLPETCQKVPSLIKVHVGTPYEKTVDVGQCMGPCSSNGHSHTHDNEVNCRPIRNRTVTLEGPNGSECMEVIEECQCVGNCYRSREFLKVYDYTHYFERKNNTNESQEVGQAALSIGEPHTKIIDIGRCEGSCRNAQVMSKCLVWSDRNETCLSSLYGGQSQCTANKFMYHSYVDKSGQKHTLISVTSCGCR